MTAHEHYMQLAIDIALKNPAAPFGTVLVDRSMDKVVARGFNRAHSNPILHGEMDAISNYARSGQNRWQDLSLYTTAEPCCMCQAAVIWAGIPEVVFGTSIAKLAELGWRQFRLNAQQIIDQADFAKCKVIGGILADQCDELFHLAK